jgi:hypothetical protein
MVEELQEGLAKFIDRQGIQFSGAGNRRQEFALLFDALWTWSAA